MEDVNELCGLVQEIVSESHGALDEKVEPDTPLLVSGLLDSLTIMRIVAAVEKARAAAGDGSPVT